MWKSRSVGQAGSSGSRLPRRSSPTGTRCCACSAAGSPTATTSAGIPTPGRIDAPALEGVDAVVHLAGEGIGERRWTDEQKRRIKESRVRGTAVLAGAIASRERKPAVFISGSAIGYYGTRGDEVLTEESGPGDDFLAGVVRGVGSRDATRGRRRHPHRHRPHRHRAGRARGRARQHADRRSSSGSAAKQGSGKQWMSWITLDDHIARPARGHRRRAPAGPGQPGRAQRGHERRVRTYPGSRAPPSHGSADAVVRAQGALRFRARRVAAAREPAGETGAARCNRVPFRVSGARTRARTSGAGVRRGRCGSGSTPTLVTIPTMRLRCAARLAPRTPRSSE